jgi:iron-sulfur cluster assembly protein
MTHPSSRPKVMILSDAAVGRIRQIMANSETPIVGIRVGVKKGGCAGMEYTMQYAKNLGPHDEVLEEKGVKILIEPKAILFLLGTEMDFKVDKLKSSFIFNNPNQSSACGCGESVAIKPVTKEQLEAVGKACDGGSVAMVNNTTT